MCASQDSRHLWERPSHSIPRKKSTTCIRRGCSASCSIGRPTSLGTRRRSSEPDGSHASRPPKGCSRPQRSLWPRADREEASSFRATAEFESRGMAIGFVLISTAPAKEHEVYNELLKVKEIVELHPLFGEYDLIAKIEAEDFNVLGQVVVDKIRSIPGVIDTKTLTGIKF